MGLSFLLCFILLLQHTSMAVSLQPNLQLDLLKGEDQLSLARRSRTKIFHPSTGFCVLRKSLRDPLELGPCAEADAWSHTPQNFLVVKGTYFCLQAAGVGRPVKLSIICTPSDSQWMTVSGSEKTHLATRLADGGIVCLDVDGRNTIVSNPCNELSTANAQVLGVSNDTQWFKLITGYKKAPQFLDSVTYKLG